MFIIDHDMHKVNALVTTELNYLVTNFNTAISVFCSCFAVPLLTNFYRIF